MSNHRHRFLPAVQAGIQAAHSAGQLWIPACAGTTCPDKQRIQENTMHRRKFLQAGPAVAGMMTQNRLRTDARAHRPVVRRAGRFRRRPGLCALRGARRRAAHRGALSRRQRHRLPRHRLPRYRRHRAPRVLHRRRRGHAGLHSRTDHAGPVAYRHAELLRARHGADRDHAALRRRRSHAAAAGRARAGRRRGRLVPRRPARAHRAFLGCLCLRQGTAAGGDGRAREEPWPGFHRADRPQRLDPE